MVLADNKNGRARLRELDRRFTYLAFDRKAVRQLLFARAFAAVGAIVAAAIVTLAIRAAFAAAFIAAATAGASRGSRGGSGERQHARAQENGGGQRENRFGKHDELTFWLMEIRQAFEPDISLETLIPQETFSSQAGKPDVLWRNQINQLQCRMRCGRATRSTSATAGVGAANSEPPWNKVDGAGMAANVS